MGRQYKKSQGSFGRKTDIRKKANKDERRAIKQTLNDGHYEGLQRKKKFASGQIEWED